MGDERRKRKIGNGAPSGVRMQEVWKQQKWGAERSAIKGPIGEPCFV